MNKKCIVFGCSNHDDQGRFVGYMCAPCYEYITTGKVGYTDSFLKPLRQTNELSIPSWDKWFMQMVYLVSTKSKDPSSKIGAVIVDEHRQIVKVGYNGFPVGVSDTPERFKRPLKYDIIVHAEANAILFAARAGVKIDGMTMYTNGMPCKNCAKTICQSGIKHMVLHKQYDDAWSKNSTVQWAGHDSITEMLFKESGVSCRYFDEVLGIKTIIGGNVVEI